MFRLANCGHTFCDTCLADLFKARLLFCPVCRSGIRRRPIKVFALLELIRGPSISQMPVSSVEPPPVWAEVWDNLVAETAEREQAGGPVEALAQELGRVLATRSRGRPLYLRIEEEEGRLVVSTVPRPERMSMAIQR